MSAQNLTMPFPVQLRVPLRVDAVLVALSTTLFLGGIVILASASIAVSEKTTSDPFFYLERQLVAAVLGLAAGGVTVLIPMSVWRTIGPLMLLAGLAMLFFVLVPGVGKEVNGARRWLDLGFMRLQVSEPARLCFIIYLAGYLVRRAKSVREEFYGFLKPMVVLGIACFALLAEPDFGAAVVLAATALAMLFVAGARFRDFLVFLGVAAVGVVGLVATSPYRMNRVTAFLDPWKYANDSGYQLTQSLIAIGRGEWFGVGLGNSVQKLFYLPEAHTDFVFAVFAEEFGLVGSLLLVALFSALVVRIFGIARRAVAAERFFEAYLAIGIGTWLGLQAFINLGVNMGILPTKGLTLPLVSYGRSSLIMTLVALALLFRIHHELVVDAAPVNRSRSTKKKKRTRR